MSSFEVKIDWDIIKKLKKTNNRINAAWHKGVYVADDCYCIAHVGDTETGYKPSSQNLECVCNEAEGLLLHEDCGYVEVFSGKYRIATVVKKLNDICDTNYTSYGDKCKLHECRT